MICPICKTPDMKFCWGGNPDGDVAHSCTICGCYILNQEVFKNYLECAKTIKERENDNT